MEMTVKQTEPKKVVHTRDPATADDGKVRMGLMSPSLPPVHDGPANSADAGRLRMGTMSPTFPPARTR
jgi:hypothetical protein